MHSVELFEQAVKVSDLLGFRLRHEWLDGTGGGACEINGQKWIFIDLALTSNEQFEQIAQALLDDPGIYGVPLPHGLRQRLGIRKSA